VIGPDAYKPTHRVEVKYVTPAATNYRKTDGSTWALRFIPTHFWLKKQDHGMHLINVIFFPIYRNEMNKNTKLIQNRVINII